MAPCPIEVCPRDRAGAASRRYFSLGLSTSFVLPAFASCLPSETWGARTGKSSLLSKCPAQSLALGCWLSVELLNRQTDERYLELALHDIAYRGNALITDAVEAGT